MTEVDRLLSTDTIRDRAQKILALAEAGSTHFAVDWSRLDAVAQLTAQVTRENYPTLEIPFHSRWSHFQVGGVDRLARLNERLRGLTPSERVKAKIDLALVSVLLDAGAGDAWKFTEPNGGLPVGRSEGLAVASLHMFLAGIFSSDPDHPYRVDARGLEKLTESRLSVGFQISDANPLVGFRGRFELLKSLGRALGASPEYFVNRRPGDLAAYLGAESHGGALQATDILTALQRSLGVIWPGRVAINGFNLGDVWPYPPLGQGSAALVPFHKLSQWLTYSLVDPLVESGLKVTGFDRLTALAEYRNGGLLVDLGLLNLRDPRESADSHAAASEIIVEWRALTVALMERVADAVRVKLGKSATELPLGKILEGGTWWAGRKIAAQKRPGGGPPLSVQSDGTVF